MICRECEPRFLVEVVLCAKHQLVDELAKSLRRRHKIDCICAGCEDSDKVLAKYDALSQKGEKEEKK
jgi:hypothetical protein